MDSMYDSSSNAYQKWYCRFPGPGPRSWPIATETLALEAQMPGSKKLKAIDANADIQRNQVLVQPAEQPVSDI